MLLPLTAFEGPSAGRAEPAANSNGCVSKPKEHATGLIGFAAADPSQRQNHRCENHMKQGVFAQVRRETGKE